MTRPAQGSQSFADLVQERFGNVFDVIISPLQNIVPVAFALPAESLKGVILTSQNGVAQAIQPLKGLPAFCVGPQTTAAAIAAGFDAKNCGGGAEAVIATIIREHPDGPLLHLRGEHGRGKISDRLTEAGITTHQRISYRQIENTISDQAIEALLSGRIVVAPLFSPRSATLFIEALPEGATPWLAVISSNTADRLDAVLQRRMMLAKTPDAEGMLDAVAEVLTAVSQT